MELLQRKIELTPNSAKSESRTVEASLSSETPVPRMMGNEILLHGEPNIDLSRVTELKGLPLLIGHNSDGLPVGMAENVRIENGRLVATLRIGNTEDGNEVWQLIQDGLAPSISIGYYCIEVLPTDLEGNYMVSRWLPYEVSFVAVPADTSVGINRAMENIKITEFVRSGYCSEDPDIIALGKQAVRQEWKYDRFEKKANSLLEQKEIRAIGAKREDLSILAEKAIADGMPLEEFRKKAMDVLFNAKPIAVYAPVSGHKQNTNSRRDNMNNFSLIRFFNAVTNPSDRAAQAAAGFEYEVTQDAARSCGKRGFVIPFTALTRAVKGTANLGGYLVPSEYQGSEFVDPLRNYCAVAALGARILTDLHGDVVIPRQSAAATASWIAEGGALAANDQTYAQVTLSPKTVGAMTRISRKMLLQSDPGIESIVQSDLLAVVGQAIDLAAIAGTGAANQPTGLLSAAGLGSVVGGTNGAIVTYQNLVDLETAVANANALKGNLAYLTNAKVRGKLKTTFTNSTYGEIPLWNEEKVNGQMAVASNQVPSNLTKGTASGICSAVIFGNWSDLLVGQWGGIEVAIDPTTYFASGDIQIRVMADVDVAVRHAESFAVMKDALTA